jgi:WhiB family redox-sensing transcriptional regulator
VTIWFLHLQIIDEDGDNQLFIGDSSWMERGACASSGALTELFFAEETSDSQATEKVHAAKRICSGCSVRPECLEWTFSTERGSDFRSGTFGGLAADERMLVAQAEDPISLGLKVLDQQVQSGLILQPVPRYEGKADVSLSSSE